jgi:hypothetical protein
MDPQDKTTRAAKQVIGIKLSSREIQQRIRRKPHIPKICVHSLCWTVGISALALVWNGECKEVRLKKGAYVCQKEKRFEGHVKMPALERHQRLKQVSLLKKRFSIFAKGCMAPPTSDKRLRLDYPRLGK